MTVAQCHLEKRRFIASNYGAFRETHRLRFRLDGSVAKIIRVPSKKIWYSTPRWYIFYIVCYTPF